MSDTSLMVPQNLEEQLRDRVRQAIVDLLPKEALDAFVKKSWSVFVDGTPESGYGYDKKPGKRPELETMIETEMRKQIQSVVDEWGKSWRETPEAQWAAKDVMTRLTQIASEGFLTGVCNSVVEQAARMISSTISGVSSCPACHSIGTRYGNCSNCGKFKG